MEIKNLEEYYKLVRSLKVEIQRLTAMLDSAEEYLFPFPLKNVSDEEIKKIRDEAFQEFVEILKKEIDEAIISNDKAIMEREKKHNVNRYEDHFCIICNGKLAAFSGINSFIDSLVEENSGDHNVV